MGRPPVFHRDRILAAAKTLVSEQGPSGLTMASLAERLQGPVGSIYHRYPSRDLLLADLWLEAVESFQPVFLNHLHGADPVEAGIAGVRFACRWVHEHREEARLLLLHRREHLIQGEWPEQYRRRATRLQQDAARGMRAYCRRLYGASSARHLRRVRFALVDLPQAALKPLIEAGGVPPADLKSLVEETCRYVLAHGERAEASPEAVAAGRRRVSENVRKRWRR